MRIGLFIFGSLKKALYDLSNEKLVISPYIDFFNELQ